MKISTVREFRDQATGLLRSKDPILVTRRGRLAGIFFPCPETTLPQELKREVFGILSANIDERGINAGVDESATGTRGLGRLMSARHSGQIQTYLGAVAVGMLALLILYAWLA